MLNKVLGLVDRTKRVGPALRVYLWWGLIVRGVVLTALATLLLVKGNFLAEWLFSWRVVPVQADVEEYTAVSYVVLILVLAIGAYVRWAVLRQMDALASEDEEDEPEA